MRAETLRELVSDNPERTRFQVAVDSLSSILLTRNPITKPSFYKIITMHHEFSIPLTMKIMALGHPLHTAQCLAAMILIQVVLVCTVMGYRVVLPDAISRPDDRPFILNCDSKAVIVRICGIFPALTGTAADTSRALLFTQ
jgi:hypothetical protein